LKIVYNAKDYGIELGPVECTYFASKKEFTARKLFKEQGTSESAI
jgi:hypothetical protein